MQIRTFRAPTINEALQLVKRELGPDAVILKNDQVSLPSKETCVEIVAAIEPDREASKPSDSALEVGLEVKEDLEEIKGLLSMLISSKDYLSRLHLQEPLAEVYHSLLMRGLDEKQTFLLLRRALTNLEDGPVSKRLILSAFCEQLLSKVQFTNPFRGDSFAKPKVFTFVGPTGVGKTTTLAKTAAYLKIKRRLEVGIISIDTYRIGAVDQVKTYANILGIPLLTAESRLDLDLALDRLQACRVILVDTIGKNFLNKQHIQDLIRIFAHAKDLHHFLVLSAAAKDEDLKATIKHFGALKIHSLIFTKTDETLTPGSMVNQLVRFSHPLSFMGTGQRVPEDLKLANKKSFLSFLFPKGNEL